MFWMITKHGPEFSTCEGNLNRFGFGKLPKTVQVESHGVLRDVNEPFYVALMSNRKLWTHEFQLLDDDKNLCYQGVCGDVTNCGGDEAFAPLDFAEADVGATIMKFRKIDTNDEWEVL